MSSVKVGEWRLCRPYPDMTAILTVSEVSLPYLLFNRKHGFLFPIQVFRHSALWRMRSAVITAAILSCVWMFISLDTRHNIWYRFRGINTRENDIFILFSPTCDYQKTVAITSLKVNMTCFYMFFVVIVFAIFNCLIVGPYEFVPPCIYETDFENPP